MNDDDNLPRPSAIIVQLGREDLDPLSLNELDARVEALEAEIVRVKAKKLAAVNHKAIAESLFKKP
jgi:uncharacterized small protein (DUF1192 family)